VTKGRLSVAELKHIAFSADGRQLALVEIGDCPRILPVEAPHDVRRLDGPPGTEHSRFAFHPNGTTLAMTNGSGTVWLSDLTTGTSEELLISSKADASIYRIQFSPNGRELAVYDGNQHEAFLYDMESSTVRDTLPDCDGNICFSPDSRLLATGAPDRTVLIWSVDTGRVLRTLAGHDGGVFDLSFSPDGRVLATAAMEGTVNIWTVDSAEQLLAIPVPFSYISGLAFAPDGKSLIVSGFRRELRGDTAYHFDGLAFFSAGDPTLHGEKFRFQLP
jgi:WD40 repeat protein